jgi:putative two-component system response regulator
MIYSHEVRSFGTSAGDDIPVMPKRAAPRVLVVDDSEEQLRLLRRVLVREGYECVTAPDWRRGVELCRAGADVILLDVELPDTDGLSICRQLKASPDTALMPVLIMTGRADDQVTLDALNAGADDFLPKPLRLPEMLARVASATRTKWLCDRLDDAAASILILGATIEARDPHTSGHCQRLATYATDLGTRIGLDSDDLIALQHGGFLHDLGKIAVPDHVLFKQGPLSADEFALIRSHPVVGDQICAPLRSLERVRPIVRHHHETLDGTGYPDGLRGSQVPLLAQVMGIVDVYDALTTRRPYRDALPARAALEVLWADVADGKRDASLVREFARIIQTSRMLVETIRIRQPAEREQVVMRRVS